jgi:hypothetical protein
VRRFSTERILLAILVVVGLLLIRGRGWTGIGILIGAAAILGLMVGLIGRRYPMIYSQNRRERRRRRSSN